MGRWMSIKQTKMAGDARKSAIFAQLSKEISVAARLGGPDPAFNFRLRNAIDKAKPLGMPANNIQKAIEKYASGKTAEQFEEILYEGYGPNGVAILLQAATDNRNRTASDLRMIFGKYDGNLGESGCVSWGFKHLGLINVAFKQKNYDLKEDKILELIEKLNLEDFDLTSDPENYLLYTSIENLEHELTEVKKHYACSAEITYLPTNKIEITDSEISEKLDKLLEKLEDYDDVNNLFHNADF